MTRRIATSKECIETVIALVVSRWPWLTRDVLLDSRHREKPVSYARWASWALMRSCGVTPSQIERHTGLDHTSVMRGLKTFDRLCAENVEFAAEIAALEYAIEVTTYPPGATKSGSSKDKALALLLTAREPEANEG